LLRPQLSSRVSAALPPVRELRRPPPERSGHSAWTLFPFLWPMTPGTPRYARGVLIWAAARSSGSWPNSFNMSIRVRRFDITTTAPSSPRPRRSETKAEQTIPLGPLDMAAQLAQWRLARHALLHQIQKPHRVPRTRLHPARRRRHITAQLR